MTTPALPKPLIIGTLVFQDEDELLTTTVNGQPAPSEPSGGSAWTEVATRQAAHIVGPEAADMLDLMMATVLCPILSPTSPVWLFVVGPPSNGKTVTAKHLEKSTHVVAVEKLTGSAFSSGWKDPKGRRAKGLMSRLDRKTLLMSETAPFFAQGEETVRRVFGDMTAAYDGSLGLATGMDMDDAVRPEANFGFLACATDANYARFEHYLHQIGTRWLIYRLPVLPKAEQAAVRRQIRAVNKDHLQRKAQTAELTARVLAHVEGLWARHDAQVGLPDDANDRLGQMAEVLAACRGTVSDEGEVSIDGASRTYQQLQTLSVALAMVRERPVVGPDELGLLWRLVLGSMAKRRARVIRAFAEHPEGYTEGLTVAQYLEVVLVSETQARTDLDELVALDLLARSIPTSETHKAVYRPTETLRVAAGWASGGQAEK